MLLEGLHLPIVTPFYPDGRLNLRKLEHNVDRYSRTPVAAMVALSEIGEPETLSDVEIRQVLGTAIDAADESKVMIAGVHCGSVFAALELCEFAASVRYDAVLLKRPVSLRADQFRETLTFFQTVADRSPLPVILDSTASSPISLQAIAELAAHPRVIGLFDADASPARMESILAETSQIRREVTVTSVFAAVTGRMLALKKQAGAATFVTAESLGGGTAIATAPPLPAIRTRTKTVGFQVVAANSMEMLRGLRAGAVGVLSGFAASAPQASYEVYAAWKDDDQPLADEKQERVAPAIATVETELGVPGIRFACDLNGYFGGRPRLPLLPLSGTDREKIERVMDGIRN